MRVKLQVAKLTRTLVRGNDQFPPHRPIYLPVERQAGWLVLVRTLRENADGSLDDWSARRSADEERGKRKEARARALREKREKAAQPHSRSYE